jgi:hypothetical protein
MSIKAQALILAALALSGFQMTASATTVGATIEFVDQGELGAPAPDEFAILNTSDAGIRIVSITIDLTLADTNYEDYEDGVPHFPRWDTAAGCSPDYCYAEEADGQPIAGGGGSDSVGFIDPTGSEQQAWDEGLIILLAFTGFDAGEHFTFTGDVDDSLDFRLSGREFAYSTMTVVFAGSDLPGGTITLTDRFYADPDNRWRSVGHVEGNVSPVPLPAGVWLLAAALGFLGARRRSG